MTATERSRRWRLAHPEKARESVRRWRAAHPEWQPPKRSAAEALRYAHAERAKRPAQWKARQAVLVALRQGRLERQPCEACGAAKAHAHHPDYSRPLDVRWLCESHHREVHLAR